MRTSDITGDRVREYLESGKRFDGRAANEFRDIEIQTGVSKNAEGSARVKIGKTEVIVGVKMGTGTPYPDSPNQGNLMTTTELLPLSSPRFEYGPPRIESIELGRVIDRFIRESKFVQLDQLCIKPGEVVWTVFIDIYTINDDGNLMDAAGIGAIVALKNAKIPKYDEKEEKVLHDEHTTTPLPLSKETPISITYHKIGNSFIVDPTRDEEDLSETRVTIGSQNGIINSMQKGEEKAIKIDDFNKVLDISESVYKSVMKKIEKSLQ